MSEPDRTLQEYSDLLEFAPTAPDENEEQVEIDISEFGPHLLAAGMSRTACQDVLDDLTLCRALQAEIEVMAKEMEAAGNEGFDAREFYRRLNAVAEKLGYYSGLPFPSLDGDKFDALVTSRRSPLATAFALDLADRQQARDNRLQAQTRNSWEVAGPDHTVLVVDTEEGPMWFKQYNQGVRMRRLLHTVMARCQSHITAQSERRAQRALRRRVNGTQWDSYVLNDCFFERSRRSDLHYLFRKGYPTLAMSFHGENRRDGKLLAALCLHPMGYQEGTMCGVMAPSDEVLAHLLLMRSNEHDYWKRAGQWKASDWRSGL